MKPYLLQHFLEIAAEKYPDKPAIQNGGSTITYSALCGKAKALGVALKQFSPERGERVGIFLDKSIDQVLSMLAVLYADKVFVLMNSALHQKQVRHIINDCRISTLLTTVQFKNSVLQPILSEPSLVTVVCTEDFPVLIESNFDREPDCGNITDDISNIIYTSGSTGVPKGVVIAHRNLIDTARNSTEHLKVSENDRILCSPALNFDYGLNQLTSTLCKGCTLVLYKYLLPNAFLQTIQNEKITGVPALPPIWASVFNPKLARIEKDKYDFSSVRYIANTGAKLPVPLVRKVRETFPRADLYLMYGFTEAFRSTFLDPKEVDRIPDSIGKALPNVQIEVINDRNEICKPGEVGELIHRGAGIAKGYWNSPELTAKVYRQNPLLPEGSQFNDPVGYSGDLVKKDEDGFIYYVGRKDHQIKTSGYRVSPTEVEALIMECPCVSEVVAFGLDDPELGQKIRALVIFSGEHVSSKDILNHCRAEAPHYLVPKEIFAVTEFPKTANGKIDRPQAIEQSIEQHGK
ncbi:MAG: AMP-binding protein [Verrucomicrobia bacterium]|nr:AMP-binding protein [Verrucomicrobiota bacterium]